MTASGFELEGEDLRRTPIEQRRRKLAKLARGPHPGILLNEVFEVDGDVLFEHACKLGCEGIVSKRLGSPYRSGRSFTALGEGQKSEGTGSEARGRRGLGFAPTG
jgi:ATP-dependent DNA ligase